MEDVLELLPPVASNPGLCEIAVEPRTPDSSSILFVCWSLATSGSART